MIGQKLSISDESEMVYGEEAVVAKNYLPNAQHPSHSAKKSSK